jgi:serine/threonine protein kinase
LYSLKAELLRLLTLGYQAIAKAYMSPEAFRWNLDTTTDPRIDIYALGVTLMELLTNKILLADYQ